MTDSARTEIIAKLRHASMGNSASQIEQQRSRLGSAPQAKLPADNLCESFLANILRNGGTADCVGGRSEAAKSVAHYLYRRYRTRKLTAGNDPRLAAMPWRDGGVLPRFGAAENGDPASVSYARMGIAESGSTLTWTGKANPAANNLLPEDHIVLVDQEDIVATMEDAWHRIDSSYSQGRRHRGINIISGPSSSADIDFQLEKGAHGPRAWHVILIADLPEASVANAYKLAGLNFE